MPERWRQEANDPTGPGHGEHARARPEYQAELGHGTRLECQAELGHGTRLECQAELGHGTRGAEPCVQDPPGGVWGVMPGMFCRACRRARHGH